MDTFTISSILRNFDGDPNIVSIVTSADLATITTAGYLTDENTNIEAINNGAFQWADTDIVLISYAPDFLVNWFVRDATNNTFLANPAAGGLTNTLANGDIFVGSAGNVATGVPVTGAIAVTNAGVTSINANYITNSMINSAAAIDFSKLHALTSGHILVGSAGNVATDVAMSGDIAITNTGVTTIQAGAITNAKVNATAAIDFSKLAALSSGNILVGSAGNVPTSVTMSGDATIIASGALTLGANVVTSSKTSKLLAQYIAVPMTAAQFNGMWAAPFQLIAAAGANTLIVVERAILAMTFVSAAYAAGGVVGLQYDNTVHGAGVAASNTEAAADFFAAASTAFQFNGAAGDTVAITPFTTSVNKGIFISNLTQAFTTGDGTWVMHLWFKVIPTV
jgi:hypothetical protein